VVPSSALWGSNRSSDGYHACCWMLRGGEKENVEVSAAGRYRSLMPTLLGKYSVMHMEEEGERWSVVHRRFEDAWVLEDERKEMASVAFNKVMLPVAMEWVASLETGEPVDLYGSVREVVTRFRSTPVPFS